MRLLFLGDIVGRPGRAVVCDALPGLIARYAIDFVVINGENAAGGFGITEAIFNDVIDAGADCVAVVPSTAEDPGGRAVLNAVAEART